MNPSLFKRSQFATYYPESFAGDAPMSILTKYIKENPDDGLSLNDLAHQLRLTPSMELSSLATSSINELVYNWNRNATKSI